MWASRYPNRRTVPAVSEPIWGNSIPANPSLLQWLSLIRSCVPHITVAIRVQRQPTADVGSECYPLQLTYKQLVPVYNMTQAMTKAPINMPFFWQECFTINKHRSQKVTQHSLRSDFILYSAFHTNIVFSNYAKHMMSFWKVVNEYHEHSKLIQLRPFSRDWIYIFTPFYSLGYFFLFVFAYWNIPNYNSADKSKELCSYNTCM